MNVVYEWKNNRGYKLLVCKEGETSKFHSKVIDIIVGIKGDIVALNIIDVGCGKDRLLENCDTFDLPKPYTNINPNTLSFMGYAENISEYVNKKYDVLYSSHLLEDFINTSDVLCEWKKILKPDGIIMLLLPDQARYERKCKICNESANKHHKIKEFGLNYMMGVCNKLSLEVIYSEKLFNENDELDIEYSFIIVCR